MAKSQWSPKAIGNGLRPNGVGRNWFVDAAPNERRATEALPPGSMLHWFGLFARNPFQAPLFLPDQSHIIIGEIAIEIANSGLLMYPIFSSPPTGSTYVRSPSN